MADPITRNRWLTKVAKTSLVITLVLVGLGIVATAIFATAAFMDTRKWTILLPHIVLVVGMILTACWALVAYGVVVAVASNDRAVHDTSARLKRVESVMENIAESNRLLADLAPLSDQAKSLIYRDQELDAIRERVNENAMRQDYQSAEQIIDNLEKRLGYADEAARLREQLQESRKATIDEKIDAACRRVENHIEQKKWTRAIRETSRLQELFPENDKIQNLSDRIREARINHKRKLLQAYSEAVRRNDVDSSIELLRQLDTYLTPQEAAALEESARDVFRAKLHNLGVEFALRVTEEQWSEALRTGEEIVAEYPNTRMAQEVREKLPQLRTRAENTQTQEA
ncbi:MAG: hypothetical protein ACLFVU_11425 [Phycisphaerae bacterium]